MRSISAEVGVNSVSVGNERLEMREGGREGGGGGGGGGGRTAGGEVGGGEGCVAFAFSFFQRLPKLACLAEALATKRAYVVGRNVCRLCVRGGQGGGRREEGEEGLADLPWVPGQSRSKVKSGRRLPSGIF